MFNFFKKKTNLDLPTEAIVEERKGKNSKSIHVWSRGGGNNNK
jgi:hypothetical protein